MQHYDWGTQGSEAYIPSLLGFDPVAGVPYAELWMGAHPKAPSFLLVDDDEVALDQWIAAHPQDLLGTYVSERFGGRLPFLLKVLSAGEVLSIQAHPNKMQAERLHAKDPEHYPDDNHKPEIAIALDSLNALIGVRPCSELAEALQRYPEIAGFVGSEVSNHITHARLPTSETEVDQIRKLFKALFIKAVDEPQVLNQAINNLANRLERQAAQLSETEQLFLELRQRYTGPDIGLITLFLLNRVHLAEGDGMFAPAGTPHAYLKGNIIECMANSDNVVRVGLTSKFKDTSALIEILQYEPIPVQLLHADPASKEVIYHTSAQEFQVSRWRLDKNSERQVSSRNRPEILIITQGEVSVSWSGGMQPYHRGESMFIPAKLSSYTLGATQGSEVFRAAVPDET